MAPHSSTFAWKIPWTEEPGRLQSMGSLESDTTERLPFHFSLSCTGEGNGNPLQWSCLENPRDGEPGGLPSLGSHRVGHDWSDLAAACHIYKYLAVVVYEERNVQNENKFHHRSVPTDEYLQWILLIRNSTFQLLFPEKNFLIYICRTSLWKLYSIIRFLTL